MNIAASIAILSFLAVSTGLMWLYLLIEARYRRALITRRLYAGRNKLKGQPAQATEAAWRRLVRQAGVVAGPRKTDDLTAVRTLLTWSGWRSEKAVTFYFGVKFCLAVTMGLLYLLALIAGSGLSPKNVIFIFFPLACGYYLPGVWLKNKVARRRQQIFRELPDVLDLLLICMQAGLSFDMALQRISKALAAMAPVLSAEFGQYFLEIRSGLPRKRVLQNLAERNGHPDLTAVVNFLLQSVRFGTDVAAALRVHISSLRTERRQAAEEKGAKISNQLTLPLVVLILPALLIIYLGPAIINIMDRLQGGL